MTQLDRKSTPFRLRPLGLHPPISVQLAYHYMHRGKHLLPLFFCEHSRTIYLDSIRELRLASGGVEVFAFCVMHNHVHLIIRANAADAAAQFLQGLAQIHGISRRTSFAASAGESPPKLVPINTMMQGLRCMRYVELNPVAAGLVERPEDGCSSFRMRGSSQQNNWLDEAPWYLALGATAEARLARYRSFVSERKEQMRSILAAMGDHRSQANRE